MIITAILATAVTVKGLVAVKGNDFKYKIAPRITECSEVAPIRVKATSLQKLPEGLQIGKDSTISGKVIASPALYTFGVECKEQRYDVSISVIEK